MSTEAIRKDKDIAARRALEAIEALRRSLDAAANEIRAAENGEPVRSDLFVPNHQYLNEVVVYGAEYRALRYATAYVDREEER